VNSSSGPHNHHQEDNPMGKIKDTAGKAKDHWKFLTEPRNSKDFGKSKADWKASKAAAKGGKK
jgi:hypothetical protein